MAISLLDIKNGQRVRRKDEEEIISSSTQPTINNSNQTISLEDIRSGKTSIKPLTVIKTETNIENNNINNHQEERSIEEKITSKDLYKQFLKEYKKDIGSSYESDTSAVSSNLGITIQDKLARKKDEEKIKRANEYANKSETYQSYLKTLKSEQESKKQKKQENLQKKINEHDTNLWDKTGRQLTSQILPAVKNIGIGFVTTADPMNSKRYEEKAKNTELTESQMIADKAYQENQNKVLKVGQDLLRTTGNMIPSIAASVINPMAGYMTTGLSSGGGAFTEGVKEGKNYNEAYVYGGLQGTKEAMLQKLMGGITAFGDSTLQKYAGKSIDNAFSKIIKNPTLRNYLGNMISEGSEEYIQEILNPVVRNIAYGENNKFKLFTEDALYSGMLGALNSALLNSPGAIRNGINEKQPGEIQKTTNSNQAISNDVNILNLGKNQAVTNENITSNINNQNIINSSNMGENSVINNTKIDFINSAKQNNIDVNTETVKTINSKLLERGIKAKFDSNEFANSNENAFWRVTRDENGKTTREVVFNPNAQTEDLLQNVAVHELYHDISNSKDGQNISKQLLEFASTKEGYLEARQSLEKLYSQKYDSTSAEFQTLVNEEAVASILGKKLGNQEFVSQLTTEKPTLSRTVYNWVVDKLNKLNKLTGYKSEKLFWTDVKSKFDNAYRTSPNIDSSNTKFMVTGYKGTKQLDRNMSTNEFSKNYKEALQLEKQGKSKQVIRKQTGWYKDVNGDWKFEISDKNIKIKNNPKKNATYKLGEIIEHSQLFDMYPSLSRTKVTFQQMNNIVKNGKTFHRNGRVNRLTGDIYLNNDIISNDKQLISTILHEVQHKIQSKENFQSGTSISYGTHKYQNNYGEMEARETATRKNMTFTDRINNPSFTSLYDGKNKKIYTKSSKKWYDIFRGDSNETVTENNKKSEIDYRKISLDRLNKELINDSFSLKENSNKWNEHLEQHYRTDGTGQTLSQVKNKVMNPIEIANLKPEDANTTPNLNKIKVETGNGKSSFYNNITKKTEMLTEENRMKLSTESDIEFYKEVTNKESLDEAYQKLNDGGVSETLNWINKKSEQATATDIAEGWILLKQYQDAKDYDSMVQVAKKMREMGTKAGQTVQAFNIMSRLTPEGMVKYAQSELTEAYNQMVKNKTKEWINKNASSFDLTPQETQFIVDTMKEVATMEDGYNKKVKLVEIQKMLQDKLPPEKGSGIKSWMRISMLFNPKTQVRNIMGNAIITPVNALSDTFSALVDKQIAKKTGVRTTGTTNIKQYGKGFKEGLYQSYNDFKKGINTRDMNGNRFEIGKGKSFKDNNALGKSLNKVDSILNFALDAGDRPFYEATFTNSINNQLVLNNTTEVTQNMIDIATQEALSRTWQDNNGYTKGVLGIRNWLNTIHLPENMPIVSNLSGYGLGDVLIPFAKTPANLTKAIVDYSPAGLVSSLLEGNKLKNSMSNGQFTAQQQHKFVQNLGKATAGTMLYVLGYALAKTKITSGKNDEDKDVADFMKNTLGIQPYSIKIGNKTFTYDWAQPVAAPFAITSDFINNTNENAQLHEKILSAMDAGFNLILEQSFMSSIQNVLTNIGGVPEGLMNQILDLPARAVPTFLKQVNDLVDGTTRASFEKGQPVKTATNKVKAKVPGLSSDLATSRDSLGRKIEKYGGENNLFNVFINPANTTKGKESESAKEIYRVYQETGDKSIMPRVAPYSIQLNGKGKTLSAEERSEFQKISGEIVEENVKKLTTNSKYKKLSDEDKAEVIYGIVGFAYNKAKSEVLDTEVSTTYKTVNKYVEKGGALYDFYANKVYKNRD